MPWRGAVKVWLPIHNPEQVLGGLPEGVEVDVYDGSGDPPASIDEVEFYVPPYTLTQPETWEIIPRMRSLKVVQLLTAGFEHVRPYVPQGVTLCNARGLHDTATSELALALMLAVLRGVPDFVRAQDAGEWRFSFQSGLADKTVLIVGYGSIGAAIEQRLQPFEVEVLRVARSPRDGVAGYESLPELLPRADVVVLAVPLTEETRGMVDEKFLARMKDGALLVNVARGPVVVTDALLTELASGRLRAALDVTDPEPLPPDHPLWRAPNVLISMHTGGATAAAFPRGVRLIREQLHRYAAGQPLINVITGEY
ncbi:dihydrofolate reductase [Carbonactinospora thermoautotrophica]|nr:dihydrofolate reductase [Carbonactinospora thermoautotrophica]